MVIRQSNNTLVKADLFCHNSTMLETAANTHLSTPIISIGRMRLKEGGHVSLSESYIIFASHV